MSSRYSTPAVQNFGTDRSVDSGWIYCDAHNGHYYSAEDGRCDARDRDRIPVLDIHCCAALRYVNNCRRTLRHHWTPRSRHVTVPGSWISILAGEREMSGANRNSSPRSGSRCWCRFVQVLRTRWGRFPRPPIALSPSWDDPSQYVYHPRCHRVSIAPSFQLSTFICFPLFSFFFHFDYLFVKMARKLLPLRSAGIHCCCCLRWVHIAFITANCFNVHKFPRYISFFLNT